MQILCDLTGFNAFPLVPALRGVYKYEKYIVALTFAERSENAPNTCQTV